jgi:hypothetical protein
VSLRLRTKIQALLRPMSADEIAAAVPRAEHRRPDLKWSIQSVADSLTFGEGTEMIHQAALQQFLWWSLPRRYPEEEWRAAADAAAELLDELGLVHLSAIARSEQTASVLAAWDKGSKAGGTAFHSAHASSGVEPPDTSVLAWGSIMGSDEAAALDMAERALGEAITDGKLVPGGTRWRSIAAAITEDVLTRTLDIPPGQSLAGLITTERVGVWIDSARHDELKEWRTSVANRLLNPITPPSDPVAAVAPFHWLLELAAAPGGVELTQSNYLARAVVLASVERFGWWDWDKAPRSEADVHQLSVVREAATRLRLIRRRGRKLHITALGSRLLANPAELWRDVAGETEDGEDFTRAVTEMVGLRLLRGRVERNELVVEVTHVLSSQGWSSSSGPITPNHVSYAVWGPLRWWRLFSVLDEVESTWERGTGRQLTPHTFALSPDGEQMVLTYLRSRAAGPRQNYYE